MQRARGLVAMARAELAVAERQIAVASEIGVENEDVTRTVHRLHGEVALLRIGHEHVVLEVLPVARFLPQRTIENLRPTDFLVAVLLVRAAHVLLDLLPDRPALRMPEHEPRCDVLLMEKI